MSGQTSVYNFYLPDLGDGAKNGRTWGTQVAANFAAIDTLLKGLSDLAATQGQSITQLQAQLQNAGILPSGGASGNLLGYGPSGPAWIPVGQAGQVLFWGSNGPGWAQPPSGLPSGGQAGQILLYTANGAAWGTAPSGLPSGGATGAVLIYASAGAAWLSPGTVGYVLTMTSAGPAWVAPSGGSGGSGNLPAYTTSDNGRVLQVVGGAPVWSDAQGAAGQGIATAPVVSRSSVSSWSGVYTARTRVSAIEIAYPSASGFAVELDIDVGPFALAGIVVKRTLAGSTAVLDTTTITFGGSATPSLPAGISVSDWINVPLDAQHDYHFYALTSASTSGSAACGAWTGLYGCGRGSASAAGNLLADTVTPASYGAYPGRFVRNLIGIRQLPIQTPTKFWDPDFPPSSPSALDDEFAGSALDSRWIGINTSSATLLVANGMLKVRAPSGGILGSILQALPSGDFTAITKLSESITSDSSSLGIGVLISSSNVAGSGSQMAAAYGAYGQQAPYSQLLSMSNFGNPSANFYGRQNQPVRYLKIRRVGSNYYWGVSPDGLIWNDLNFTPSFTPGFIGLCWVNSSDVAANFGFEFFRIFQSGAAEVVPGSWVGQTSRWQIWDPDKPPAVPSALDDEFETPGLASRWTSVNLASLVATDVATTVPGCLYAQAAGMGRTLAAWLQAIPTGDFSVYCKVAASSASGSPDYGVGLILSSTNAAGSGNQINLNLGGDSLKWFSWSNFNSIGSAILSSPQPVSYYGIRRTNGAFSFGWSPDGKTWTWTTKAVSFTPAYFGLHVQCYQSERVDCTVEWFRYFPSATALPGGQRTFCQ